MKKRPEHFLSKTRRLAEEGEETPEESFNVSAQIKDLYTYYKKEGADGLFRRRFSTLLRRLASGEENLSRTYTEDREALRRLSEMNAAYKDRPKQ